MAYKIKPENYTKKPSAEMRKLWTEAWQLPIASAPTTRIAFNIRVKEMLAGEHGANGPELKAKLRAWRERRQAAREARQASRIAAQNPVEEARNA